MFDQITKLASQAVEERISNSKRVTELVDKAVDIAEQNLKHIVTSALTSVLVRSIRDGLERTNDLLLEHETLKTTVDEMKSRLLPE